GLLLSGTAGAMWLFILGRAVQGLGGGLVTVPGGGRPPIAVFEHPRPEPPLSSHRRSAAI
ncbi:hypothetical protein ACWDAZ_32440, partial [Streptomyces sp. NPDC001215]